MRLQTRLNIGGALVLTALLAACGSNGGGSNSVASTPGTSGTLESKFGTEFASIFDAASTAQPATIDNNSVPPLQPADQPVSFSSSSSS